MKWYLVQRDRKHGILYRCHKEVKEGWRAPGCWTTAKSEARFWDKEYKAHRMHDSLGNGLNMSVVTEEGIRKIMEELDRVRIQRLLSKV